jgi:two-component system, NarL family, invasion response regulator UvrY
MKSNRVLIADDHSIVRSGLKLLIKEIQPSFITDEAVDGDEVISLARSNDYALIILDINMPDTDAISLVCNLVAGNEAQKILIFSMNSEELYAKRYLKLGVRGYLSKDSKTSELKAAILSVMDGKTYISQKCKEYLHERIQSGNSENPFENLTDREMQIAKFFLLGYTYAEIQKTLNLHTSTIGTHKMRLLGKLNIKSLIDLGKLAKLYHLDVSKL